MGPQYDAVLFDMDGVTVETADVWRELEETEILPAATAGDVPFSEIRGRSVDDAYDRLQSLDDVETVVSRSEFRHLFDDHAEEVYGQRATLLAGDPALLDAVDSAGYQLGLVSASPRRWVRLVLDRFELHSTYDVVVTSSDIEGPSKPDPTTYRVAASDLGVDSERCLVVEDSPHGIESATRAGATCLAVRGEGNADLDLSRAHHTVDAQALRDRLETLLSLDS